VFLQLQSTKATHFDRPLLLLPQLEAVSPSTGRNAGRNYGKMTQTEIDAARGALSSLKARWDGYANRASREEQHTSAARNSTEFSLTASLVTNEVQLQQDELERTVERIAEVGRASDGPAQVSRWLCDVLTVFEGDTQPADNEAVRFLVSFASSLRDPDLGVAPSIQEMPTLSTLVPHYNVSARLCWLHTTCCLQRTPGQRCCMASAAQASWF
jgi:hypothetical protein